MPYKQVLLALVAIVSFALFLSSDAFDVRTSLLSSSSQVANVVGIHAGVEPNDMSRIAQQLEEKEDRLVREEAELRYIAERIAKERTNDRRLLAGAFVLLIIVFALLVVNYYYDLRWRRHDRA